MINDAEDLFDYKLKILKTRHNAARIEGKAAIASEMLSTIKRFKNAILKSEYLKKLARELNLKEEAILQEIGKIKEDKVVNFEPAQTANKNELKINPTERLLVKLMLEEKGLIDQIKHRVEPADFESETVSKIVSLLFDMIEQGKNIEPSLLVNHFGDEGVLKFICESTFTQDITTEDKDKIVEDCIGRLKHKSLNHKQQRLQEEIKIAEGSGDEEGLERLKHEFNILIKKRRIKNEEEIIH